MISLSAQITGMIVTVSIGLFLTMVVLLCVVPLFQASVDRSRPSMPALPPIFENLGIALAIAGFTFRVTEVAAVGVGLALLGAVLGSAKGAPQIHPLLEKVVLVFGVVGLGVLGEYYYVVS